MSTLTMLVLGAVGGALNALLADDLKLWPLVVRVSPRTRVIRLGLGGNVALGALTALAAAWVFAPADRGGSAALFPSVTGVLLGLLAARWATNEADKHLLRAAACKACAAPAAHPDTVRAIEVASPWEAYNTAERLMPRHRA